MGSQQFRARVGQVAGGNIITNVFVQLSDRTDEQRNHDMTSEEMRAELRVQSLMLRVLLTDLVARQPSIVTTVRDAIESMQPSTPEGADALRKWSELLRVPPAKRR